MCRSKHVIADVSDQKELVFQDTVHSKIAVVNEDTKPWVMDIQLNDELKTVALPIRVVQLPCCPTQKQVLGTIKIQLC